MDDDDIDLLTAVDAAIRDLREISDTLGRGSLAPPGRRLPADAGARLRDRHVGRPARLSIRPSGSPASGAAESRAG